MSLDFHGAPQGSSSGRPAGLASAASSLGGRLERLKLFVVNAHTVSIGVVDRISAWR
jgi:hypothetical protein